MYGSIYTGYLASPKPAAEYNVRIDPQSLQSVFAAPWECTITPLDTCGLVVLDGDNYRRLYLRDDPWLQALMENYRASLRVTDDGYTIIDPVEGRPVRCAVGWQDLEAYELLLVDTLLG